MSLFENWRNWNETNLVCVCGQRSERSRFSTATSNDLRPGNLIIFCLGLNALMAKRLTPCPLARYFQPVRVLIRLSVWAIFTRSVLGHGRLRSRYPDLNLPLEQFFQDALYHIVPAQAKSYDPSYGRTFTSYVVSMLKKRFSSFVDAHKTAYTTPVRYGVGNETTKGKTQGEQRAYLVCEPGRANAQSEQPANVTCVLRGKSPYAS